LVLLEGAPAEEIAEEDVGAGIDIVGLVVGGEGFAFTDADDVVFGLIVEPLLLVGVDDVVGGGDAAARVADDVGIIAKTLECLNLHDGVLLSGNVY